MPKSKNHLDLNIKREVADAFKSDLESVLTEQISDTPDSFAVTYLATNLVTKYVDERTDPASDRRHRAIVKWLSVERRNKRTNVRLFETDPFFNGIGYGHIVLSKVAKLIERTIGAEPPSDLLSKGSFSGGATTSLKRDVGTLERKFSGIRDVTPECWEVLSEHLLATETWLTLNPDLVKPRFVKGNILFTVPKTAVIDRVACKEPDYNIYAQKAVGDFLRSRLRRKARIDLNDQSVNRKLAYEASKDGKLATIDLSSASDSLTCGLVSLVLPYSWLNLLQSLRCSKTFIDGRSHVNEMFSSMGNGFTFELESLIFWAIAHTIRGRTKSLGVVSVYGDDIICPSSCAGVLITFLSWVGFTVNVRKTFIVGRFRESCGGHYYRGLDVTPFYLRRPIKDVSDLILTLNQLRAWIIRTGLDWASTDSLPEGRFVALWYRYSRFIPKVLRGGWDLSSRTQLAGPGIGSHELIPVSVRCKRLELELQSCGYLQRLSEYDRRGDSLPPDTTEWHLSATPNKYRLRRVKVVPHVFGLVRPTFLSEQWVWETTTK